MNLFIYFESFELVNARYSELNYEGIHTNRDDLNNLFRMYKRTIDAYVFFSQI